MFHTEERPNVDINAFLIDVTGEIDAFMYTYILLALLVATGIWYTIRTKAVQIRYIKDMFTQLTEKKHVGGKRSISSFRRSWCPPRAVLARAISPASQPAIATGGPGAVFWMWLMAIVGAASAFVESTLAQIFKVRGEDGEFAVARLITSSRVWVSAGWAWCSPCCSSCASRSASTACSRSMLRAR